MILNDVRIRGGRKFGNLPYSNRIPVPPLHGVLHFQVLPGVREKEPPGGAIAVILNVIWILVIGLELATFHLLVALVLAITIVGLPLASQHLKMTRLALLPFGFEVLYP